MGVAGAAYFSAWAISASPVLAGELRSPESAVAIWLPAACNLVLFAIACSYPGSRLSRLGGVAAGVGAQLLLRTRSCLSGEA